MEAAYLTNLARIRAVAQALKPLNQKVVFVGGATVALYTDPQMAQEVRPTDDVDVVVELATYGDYVALEERLRAIGFVNDTASKVVCRYKIQGITVDIMPTDPQVIGFSNQWYAEGFAHSISFEVGAGLEVQIFPLAYLLASKLEAFFSRGNSDFLFSRDFEDIVYVFENAVGLEEAFAEASGNLSVYLREAISGLQSHPDFEEGLYAHLYPAHATYQVQRIREIFQRFLKNK